jgi:serine/threonine protein kinase
LSSFAAGSTLCNGRYRLEDILGRGGMAIVWRARDTQLERDVAIKVISDVLASDPRFVARFEHEARLAAGLSHANLVKVFDFSTDGERPFLVMEYVPGGTLAQARGQALDAEALARDLLDALAHIHGAGILHRDIKPANVLLGADGSPRLTDFGIARGEETSGLTQTGQVLGTLRYIAPEVAAGEPATAQSDLYSLGVMLGELQSRPSDALSRLLPQLAAHDPHDRPASAAAALAELDPTRVVAESTTTATVALDVDPAPADPSIRAYPSHRRLGGRRPLTGFSPTRNQTIGAIAALLAILAIVIVAASSGGGSGLKIPTTKTIAPAPAGAPVSQQVTQLERLVRALPKQ